MTREQMITKLMRMANDMMRDYSWEKWCELWRACSDWNWEHDDEEIFMSETCDENDRVNGFMIEDDVWYWTLEG